VRILPDIPPASLLFGHSPSYPEGHGGLPWLTERRRRVTMNPSRSREEASSFPESRSFMSMLLIRRTTIRAPERPECQIVEEKNECSKIEFGR